MDDALVHLSRLGGVAAGAAAGVVALLPLGSPMGAVVQRVADAAGALSDTVRAIAETQAVVERLDKVVATLSAASNPPQQPQQQPQDQQQQQPQDQQQQQQQPQDQSHPLTPYVLCALPVATRSAQAGRARLVHLHARAHGAVAALSGVRDTVGALAAHIGRTRDALAASGPRHARLASTMLAEAVVAEYVLARIDAVLARAEKLPDDLAIGGGVDELIAALESIANAAAAAAEEEEAAARLQQPQPQMQEDARASPSAMPGGKEAESAESAESTGGAADSGHGARSTRKRQRGRTASATSGASATRTTGAAAGTTAAAAAAAAEDDDDDEEEEESGRAAKRPNRLPWVGISPERSLLDSSPQSPVLGDHFGGAVGSEQATRASGVVFMGLSPVPAVPSGLSGSLLDGPPSRAVATSSQTTPMAGLKAALAGVPPTSVLFEGRAVSRLAGGQHLRSTSLPPASMGSAEATGSSSQLADVPRVLFLDNSDDDDEL